MARRCYQVSATGIIPCKQSIVLREIEVLTVGTSLTIYFGNSGDANNNTTGAIDTTAIKEIRAFNGMESSQGLYAVVSSGTYTIVVDEPAN